AGRVVVLTLDGERGRHGRAPEADRKEEHPHHRDRGSTDLLEEGYVAADDALAIDQVVQHPSATDAVTDGYFPHLERRVEHLDERLIVPGDHAGRELDLAGEPRSLHLPRDRVLALAGITRDDVRRALHQGVGRNFPKLGGTAARGDREGERQRGPKMPPPPWAAVPPGGHAPRPHYPRRCRPRRR